jgi:hypothetical protein
MEKTMIRFTLLLFVALLTGVGRLAAQETVDTRGITSVIKVEEIIFGHLTELNGKFKLRGAVGMVLTYSIVLGAVYIALDSRSP